MPSTVWNDPKFRQNSVVTWNYFWLSESVTPKNYLHPVRKYSWIGRAVLKNDELGQIEYVMTEHYDDDGPK